jgi:hypothetical protein
MYKSIQFPKVSQRTFTSHNKTSDFNRGDIGGHPVHMTDVLDKISLQIKSKEWDLNSSWTTNSSLLEIKELEI